MLCYCCFDVLEQSWVVRVWDLLEDPSFGIFRKTAGHLPNSKTPMLQISKTPKLPNSQTPKLQYSTSSKFTNTMISEHSKLQNMQHSKNSKTLEESIGKPLRGFWRRSTSRLPRTVISIRLIVRTASADDDAIGGEYSIA